MPEGVFGVHAARNGRVQGWGARARRMCAVPQPRPRDRRKIGSATEDPATEAAMSRLFQAARDILAAVAASIYFLGFLGAIHAALDRLSY